MLGEVEMADLTGDTFFNGRIRVMQSRKGHRFSIDAVLLAHQVLTHAADTVLDLGTGCGIIPLILAWHRPGLRIYGAEIQEELAETALLNVRENDMAGQISILHTDMRTLKSGMIPGPVNLVVCNPPYRKADSGRINPNPERAVARHEIKATLRDALVAAGRILPVSGKFLTIYPAERLTDLLTEMRAARIEAKFVRMIHSGPKTGAKLILAEGARGGRPGVKIGPPLVIYGENGDYTEEVGKMFDA